MSKILVLEDDISLIDGLRYSLNRNGFDTDIARTVKEALEMLREQAYELLLLDVTLPDGTGFEVCDRLRKQGNQVPIIFLTAADEEINIIRGLDSGGDDYITKPFRLGELCSRMRALLRRSGIQQAQETNVIRSGNIMAELRNCRILKNGIPLELTGAEYRLFLLFLRNSGRVFTRTIILEELWDGAGNYVDDNTLNVYIRRLREKIEEDPSDPKQLLTVRGFGYRWNEVAE